MVSEGRRGHCPLAILATYPDSLPFPKFDSLPCRYPLVRLNSLLTLNEPRNAHHCLGIPQFCMWAFPLGYFYHFRQFCLYPDRIAAHYLPIICVESDVVLSSRPSEPMLGLLVYTDLQEGRPDHFIHYYIEYHGYTGSPCVTPLPMLKGLS